MRFEHLGLRQRDGVTCGPSVAIVASMLLDGDYAANLGRPGWFGDEQGRLHRRLNLLWPRAFGTTPRGMVRALSWHSVLRYRWRFGRGRADPLLDVREAVLLGCPVPMLIGRFVPRHWVLVTGWSERGFRCWEPSSGHSVVVTAEDIRRGGLQRVGFPRAFGFVLPARPVLQHG